MVANAAGNYIDNAIAALDEFLVKHDHDNMLLKVRGQLVLMQERDDFVPTYGRYLVDTQPDSDLVTLLLETAEWRRRALLRR